MLMMCLARQQQHVILSCKHMRGSPKRLLRGTDINKVPEPPGACWLWIFLFKGDAVLLEAEGMLRTVRC